MGHDWPELFKSGKVSKLSVGELKAFLKEKKLPMAGEKADLIGRVANFHDCATVPEVDGVPTLEIKPAQLRKACARRGLNPMAESAYEKDELLRRLLDHELAAVAKASITVGGGSSGGAAAGGGGGGGGAGGGPEGPDGVAIAKKVMTLEDDIEIISAGGAQVTASTATAALRKAYLKLSLLIHPDKIGRVYPDATKAFQKLVMAYERLSNPDVYGDGAAAQGDGGGAKADESKLKERSNAGCRRTQVYCPRCKSEWGMEITGVEKWAYTVMMLALKTYHCATCLLQFGCMTAKHRCPHCRKPFDYHPNDYNRKVHCGNEKCKQEFGFMWYQLPRGYEKELRAEVKAAQEKHLKAVEAAQRRSKSRQDRGGVSVPTEGKAAEKLFLSGLVDQCPRCGWHVPRSADSDSVKEHLRGCNDATVHAKYQERQANLAAAAAKKDEGAAKQAAAQGMSAWELLGGEATKFWMLTDVQLRQMAKDYGLGLDDAVPKEEVIAVLVRHRNSLDSARLLTDGAEGQTKKAKQAAVTVDSLPSNLHDMSEAQLKCVAAAHGVVPKGGKQGIIAELEGRLMQGLGHSKTLLLTDAGGDKAASSKRQLKAKGEEDAEWGGGGDDSDDEPLAKKSKSVK